MPRPRNPLTPASSTEIKGKDGSQYAPLQMSFELPPPAVAGSNPRPSSGSSKASSASSYHPASPTSPATASEVVKIRRRSSIPPAANKDAFALPPPPTRSRKIIQMKPRGQPEETAEAIDDATKSSGAKTPSSKKKQPSATSVAGRKIARKTAHSLIERRRRSKMNEEFGVLKDMIPACTGEMHKLAILQASIDYIRYLEDCVSQLKASNTEARSNPTLTSEQFMLPPPASLAAYKPREYQPTEPEQEDTDMEGTSDQAVSPTHVIHPARSQPHSARPSVSPAILPQDRHNSYSSTSMIELRNYSFSAGTSPALGPTMSTHGGSALTSPALMPQRGSGESDLDQEATAALLMLNCDRRGTFGGGRGMSVKDLLSS